MAERVTDHDNNYTRFVLIGHEPVNIPREPDHVKTSLLVTLPEDAPGALHQVLSAFAWRKLNLTRLESRPTKKRLEQVTIFTLMLWKRSIRYCLPQPWQRLKH